MTAVRKLLLIGMVHVFALVLYAGAGPAAGAELEESSLGEFQDEWDAMLKAAQAEGALNVFAAAGLGEELRREKDRFEEQFGIEWNHSFGSSSSNAQKILAERKAGVYSLDVWMGGTRTAESVLLPAGALDPIKPALVHPEVVDGSLWRGGAIAYADAEQKYLLAFGGDGLPSDIGYNTDLVDPGEIKSYWDLLDPKWKGKIVARHPLKAGVSGPVTYYYIHPDLGPEYLTRLLTEMDITFYDSARRAAEAVASGDAHVCLFGCRRALIVARRDGLPVEPTLPHKHIPKEGGRLQGGGSHMWLMNRAPHSNAAQFFINWWLAREGQYWFQDLTGSNSRRTDIPKDNVLPEQLPREGVTYLTVEQDPKFIQTYEEEVVPFIRKLVR